jgi:type IV secretion system protein VirD4
MVSRSETARPLLTPGEIMQLPPSDEIVMVSGIHPIRAKKARYYDDRRFTERAHAPRPDDWSNMPVQAPSADLMTALKSEDEANGGLRREPELPDHVAVAKETTSQRSERREFDIVDDTPDEAARQQEVLRQRLRNVVRQTSLDPADDLGM